MLYAYSCIMCLDLLHPFATLCLSRGRKPVCAHRPQPGAHPAQAFSFWKTLRPCRRLNALSKHLAPTRSKHRPSLYIHPRTSSACPPHTKTSWVFNPFMRLSNRFMVPPAASSITRILPTHPSRILLSLPLLSPSPN